MNDDQLRQQVVNKIEEYHQANFWDCFPAGPIRNWVYDAVLHSIVKPMQAEIDELKADKEFKTNKT